MSTKDWIQSHDGGTGTAIAYETRLHQSYVIYLNESEVTEVKKLDSAQCVIA